MGGKRKNIWTKEADQALISLLKIYGEHRWAEVTRQMQKIYGFNFKGPNIVSSRWNRINPNIDKSTFSREDEIRFFQLVKQHTNNWNQIQREMKTKFFFETQYFHQSIMFFSIFRRSFRRLNNVMGKLKENNKLKIEKIKPAVFMKIMRLNQEPDPKDEDYAPNDLFPRVVRSCKKILYLVELIYTSDLWESRPKIYNALTNLTDKDEVQCMLEHIFLMNTMHQIEHQMIIPIEIKEHIAHEKPIDRTDARSWWSKPKGAKKILTWDEALSQAEETYSEDEEDLMNNKKRFDEDQKFTMQEIQFLKESTLYRRLFQNERKIYYDWYNSAVIPKCEDKKFLMSYEEIIKEQEEVEKTEERNESNNTGNQIVKKVKRAPAQTKKKPPSDGDEDYEEGEERRAPPKRKKPSHINTLRQLQRKEKEQGKKVEPLHMKNKKARQTFRDRYTMFRDEDYIKEEIDEGKNDIEKLYSQVLQEEKKLKSSIPRQKELFEDEIDSLFGI